MKKILLIGDSIRQGYDKYVRMAFEGEAEIYYSSMNSRFSIYVLREISYWKEQLKLDDTVDCVHWNAGLWDDLVWHDGKHLVPIELYADYIDRICLEIKRLFPRAKIIFATSTPVQEHLFKTTKRYNSDTEKYNAVAVEAVLRHGGEINDLYGLMSALPDSYHSDLTHYYTKEGTRVLTEQVVACLENALAIKGKALDYDTLFAEKTDAEGH